MPSNKFSSLSTCQSVLSKVTTDPSFVSITNFMRSPIADPSNTEVSNNYGKVKDFFVGLTNGKFNNSPNDLSNNGIKFLLALDDGTVIIDTGKKLDDNNMEKYKGKSINSDNHNTRPEILQATLSSSGVGSAERFSSSNGDPFQYYAVRLGNGPSANVGTLRVAFNENCTDYTDMTRIGLIN